jgi:hypothetical protein
VPSSPGPRVFWWIRLATGMSRSSVCSAMSMPARVKRRHTHRSLLAKRAP